MKYNVTHIFYVVLIVLVFFVPLSSATYYQIENSTTVIANNITSASTVSATYTTLQIIPIPQNGSGTFSFNFWARATDLTSKIQIWKNGVAYSSEFAIDSSTNATRIEGFTGQLNTTDLIELKGKAPDVSGSVFLYSSNLTYDYSTVTITAPANNSASTSRTQNITWTGGYPDYQYQVSTSSDFLNLTSNYATSNSYSGGTTFSTGLNYIRVRGYNAGINETNWSSIYNVYIIDSLITEGGSGYNWTINTSNQNYTAIDQGTKYIWAGSLYYNSFDNNQIGEFECIVQTTGAVCPDNYTLSNGQLNAYNVPIVSSLHFILPDTYTNFSVLMNSTITVRNHATVNGKGYVFGWQNNTNFYWGLWYNNPVSNYFRLFQTSGNTVLLNDGAYYNDTLNVWNPVRMTRNGSWMGLRYWNTTESEPTRWNSTTNGTFLTGRLGILLLYQNSSHDDFWVQPIDSGGNSITTGNITFNIKDLGHGNYLDMIRAKYVAGNANISIYLNTSMDNSTWSGKHLFQTNVSNDTVYPVNNSNEVRYVQITLEWTGGTPTSNTPLMELDYGLNQYAISGYVHYPNATVMGGATVITAHNTTTTDSDGYYYFQNVSTTPNNLTIVAGKDGYYASGDIILDLYNNSPFENRNFTLATAPSENPNQLNTLSYNLSRDYLPYINASGHLVDLPYGETQWEGYTEGMLAEVIGINSRITNFTPEYLEAGLRILNHMSYDIIRSNHFGKGTTHDTDSPHTEFMMWGATYAMRKFQNNVSSTQWTEWNNTMQSFNSSWYYTHSTTDNNIGYLTSNWNMVLITAEAERRNICGSCVNDTEINNIIQKYNNSVTANGYPQGAELSSNYNTLVYTLARMIQESGYDNTTLNATIELQRPSVLNASMQDGNVMAYYRSAGHTASYAQNIYNLMRETENRGEAYRFADLQYQKIAGYPDDIYNVGYYPLFHFYNTSDQVGFASYTKKHLQDSVTGMFMARAANVYDNSIVETPRNYYTYKDLIDSEVTSDSLYNSSGVIIINPSNYSAYVMGKFQIGVSDYPYYNGSVVMPLIPIITTKDAQNYTTNPMPEVSGGFLGATRDDSYAFPMMFDNKTIRHSLDFTATHSYGDADDNSFNLNLTDLNYTTKFIDNYNLTVEYNSSTDMMDVTVNVSWDNTTYPLNHFEYGIPFIVDDNRTVATITGNATAGTINYNRGADTVNISNITLTNATDLSINTSTGFIGYVPFGKSEVTTIEGTITQSPITLKYSHAVSTTNEYGYGLNQPPGVFSYSPETPVTDSVGGSRTFSIGFTQDVDITWYMNGTAFLINYSSSASYTNTSAEMGSWNITAIATNDQGQAQKTWIWDVSENPIPPTPINLINTSGNFWINHSWQAGSGNITDSYNISQNGNWTNGSSLTYNNTTVLPHGWSNISVYAYNNSGLGILNTTPISMNTQLPNNALSQGSIGNQTIIAGNWLNFTINVTDADSDTITYGTNASKGTLTTNSFNYSALEADVGTYTWYFNSSDGYGSTGNETITVTVQSGITNYIPPSPIDIGYTNGSTWVNHTWSAGIGNLTDSYNINHNGAWTNSTTNNYFNATVGYNSWSNISIYAYNSSGNGTLNSSPISQQVQTPPMPINAPIINYNLNNITSSSATDITINVNNGILFSVGANQTITSWYWTNATQIGGNATTNSTASYHFTSVGDTSVSIYGSNSNGSTSTLTWTIHVVEDGGSGTDWDWAYGWIRYPNGTGINGVLMTVNTTPTRTANTDVNGYYQFDYYFVHGNSYFFNATNTGYDTNNTTVDFLLGYSQIVNLTMNVTATPPALPAPAVSSWANNNTSNASTDFNSVGGTIVEFNVTTDQVLTSRTWGGGAVETSYVGTTSTATRTLATGTNTITFYGTNVNGTTSTVTWTVHASSPSVCSPTGEIDSQTYLVYTFILIVIIIVIIIVIVSMIQISPLVGVLVAGLLIILATALFPDIVGTISNLLTAPPAFC